MKLKFIDYIPSPDDSIIAKHQDFDNLLKKYNYPVNHPAFRSLDTFTVVISIILLSYTIYMSQEQSLVERRVQIEEINKEEPVVPEKPKAKLPDIVFGVEKKDSAGTTKSNSVEQNQGLLNQEQPKKGSPTVYSPATPIDGLDHLYKYFSSTVMYPDQALGSGISGEVIIEFTITKTGEIVDVEVIESLGPDFDAEALKLILNMPSWNPASVNGHTINSRLSLPITFQETEKLN